MTSVKLHRGIHRWHAGNSEERLLSMYASSERWTDVSCCTFVLYFPAAANQSV